MRNEFTAIIEREGDWFISYAAEIPGANGQGHTKKESLDSLRDAIVVVGRYRTIQIVDDQTIY